jgi:alpha-mannosidase
MKARVSFLARAPGCGWSVYSILPSDKDNPSAVTRETPGDTLETQITHGSIRSNTLRVKVDPKTGAVLSLKDDNISEALSAPANVIARLPDNGDLWELYHSLNGESHLPTMTIQPVPTSATALLSTACGGKPGIIRTGPVYSEFSVAYPFGKGELSTIVRVVRDSPRVEIETSVVNREPHVRYQALFPVAVNNGKQVQGIPFGSVERPLSVEYPAQDWIDFSDASHGVTLLNAALPGNLVSGNTMMLSLLRAVGEGDYNGGDTSDTGMELNVKRTMRYALVAHDGSVRPSAAAQLGQEFNSPFLVLKAEPHRGKLMPFSGLIGTNPDIVISSVKPGAGGGVVIRMFEASGKAQQAATVSFRRNIDHADETNLLEDPVRHVPFSGSDLRVDFRAFEIKTIKVKLR